MSYLSLPPPRAPRVMLVCAMLVLLCVAGLSLSGCGVLDIEQDEVPIGSESPEMAITTFFEYLNQALNDPELAQEETRRAWAERLSSYFAPSERVDQRVAMRLMLEELAADLDQIEENQLMTLEIDYTGTRVVEQQGELVRVHLMDATIRYRRILVRENGYRSVLRDQQRPLYEVLGQENEAFSVIQVNGRWFITER